MAQWLTNPSRKHEVAGSVPGLTGLRIRRCRELWCRSQAQLGSGIAVVMVLASIYNSDLTSSLGTSIYCGCNPKKKLKKKEKKKA